MGRRRSDRGIKGILIFFTLLFLAMIGYMVYFLLLEAPDRIGNPYNARMELFDSRYIRGSLLSQDGEVLARTELSEDGEEIRVYPYGRLFAHVLGYSSKGKTGLEQAANFYLLHSNLNPVRQVKNELLERKSQGDNVVTSLHAGLQRIAADALGDRAGAVVCMEPASGRILCMLSKPDFDPNTLDREWEALVSDDNHSGNLLNRATQGLYAPGSTFKTVMALSYLRAHGQSDASFRYDCRGAFRDPVGGGVVHCYEEEAHGEEDLRKAFANSCNAAFAYLGTDTRPAALQSLAESLLFNQDLPVPIACSKSRISLPENAGNWTMMQSAIGQGELLMTPLHTLLLTSAIANDGVLEEPVFLLRAESADGHRQKTFGAGEQRRLMSAQEARFLQQYMRAVVEDGTGSGLRGAAYQAAGKTGSAEFQEGGSTKTHAWFTGYAPADKPQIAVTVLVEEGETGGRTAVPIAKALMDYWILGNDSASPGNS